MEQFASNLVFGGIAGIIGTTTVFPIDMVKTRLQNQSVRRGQSRAYNGVLDCFQKIVKKEGFKGLYRGLAANLVGVTPEKAIKLSANDFFRAYFERWYFETSENSKRRDLPLIFGAISGGAAGLCQVVATNPMEIVKIRMQLQAQQVAVNSSKSTIQVVQDLGLKGLYQGTCATLIRDIPFSMLYFSLYGKFKDLMKDSNGDLPFYKVLTSGLGAGMISSAAVTPMDVVKTRLQSGSTTESYSGVADCFKKIIQNEGAPALFKGVVPRVLIVSPLFGITLMFYEVQQKLMQKQ